MIRVVKRRGEAVLSEITRRGILLAVIAAVMLAALLLPYFMCGGSGGLELVREGSFLRVSVIGRVFVLDLDIAGELLDAAERIISGAFRIMPFGFIFDTVIKCY